MTPEILIIMERDENINYRIEKYKDQENKKS